MNKILKKTVSGILLATMCCGCFGMTSCRNDGSRYDTVESNGHTYYYSKDLDHYIWVSDTSAENPKVMMIEPYFNGKELKRFGIFIGGGWSASGGTTPSLKGVEELYIPYNMVVSLGVEEEPGFPDLKKVTLVNNIEDESNLDGFLQGSGFNLFCKDDGKVESRRSIYLTPIGYDYRVKELLDRDVPWTEGTKEYSNGEYHFYLIGTIYKDRYYCVCKANTSYMFNYEGSPNDDYFFIRDYEYGEKIENTPYEPMREGYTFGGWYKEAECINAWNFEKDTLPETLYNENDEEVYQETKLYAKWIEN